MQATLYVDKESCRKAAVALLTSAQAQGDRLEVIYDNTPTEYPSIYLDRFTHHKSYRVSVGSYYPQYLGKLGMPEARRISFLWWNPKPWRMPNPKGSVAIACMRKRHWSQNYKYTPEQLRKEIKERTTRPIIDWWAYAENVHVLVTPDAYVASLDAILRGIPVITLKDGIARSISSISLDYLEYPYLAYNEQRMNWLNDLAYCHWHLSELRDGSAWRTIRTIIEVTQYD